MKAGWLKRPDCSIYYEVHGSGPAIVFAHGLGGNHLSWWQQVAHFSTKYSCVTFAHRGFSPSTAVDGAKAPESYADDLAALVAELDLKEFRLVAQSMGGWTSIEYLLRDPSRVKALVLASTSGTLDFRQLKGPEAAEIKAWIALAPKVMADLEARDILVAGGERFSRDQPALAMLYRQIGQLTGADSRAAEFKAAVRPKIMQMRVKDPALLARLPMPVLFLGGDEDCLFPAAACPGFAALAPKGRAVRVPKAGHSVYFEHAAEFNRIVEDFLQ
jgi:pimeloyl-ACP methyl ester carboxylesterase